MTTREELEAAFGDEATGLFLRAICDAISHPMQNAVNGQAFMRQVKARNDLFDRIDRFYTERLSKPLPEKQPPRPAPAVNGSAPTLPLRKAAP